MGENSPNLVTLVKKLGVCVYVVAYWELIV
jgi:hypothetical protein